MSKKKLISRPKKKKKMIRKHQKFGKLRKGQEFPKREVFGNPEVGLPALGKLLVCQTRVLVKGLTFVDVIETSQSGSSGPAL